MTVIKNTQTVFFSQLLCDVWMLDTPLQFRRRPEAVQGVKPCASGISLMLEGWKVVTIWEAHCWRKIPVGLFYEEKWVSYLVLNFWHLQKSNAGCLWWTCLWMWPPLSPTTKDFTTFLSELSFFVQDSPKLPCIWVFGWNVVLQIFYKLYDCLADSLPHWMVKKWSKLHC